MNSSKVIIIGAPRSGTNMLRDMLVRLPGVGTWPCDEINYIWRHGNLRYPSDEFSSDMATPEVQRYIWRQFEKLSQSNDLDVVIEKTCANSLRVDYVDKLLPDAKYVFIVRDGLDAVGSALHRWTASLDIPYLMRKARYVPPADLPYYAIRYMVHRVHRVLSKEKRLAMWGPAMADIDELLMKYSLPEVCALQWQACVDKAEESFLSINPERIIRVKYENFVLTPFAEYEKIADFIGKDVPDDVEDYLNKNINSDSINKGRRYLTTSGVDELRPLISDTMDRYGYE